MCVNPAKKPPVLVSAPDAGRGVCARSNSIPLVSVIFDIIAHIEYGTNQPVGIARTANKKDSANRPSPYSTPQNKFYKQHVYYRATLNSKCYFAMTDATTPIKPIALARVTPITTKKIGP